MNLDWLGSAAKFDRKAIGPILLSGCSLAIVSETGASSHTGDLIGESKHSSEDIAVTASENQAAPCVRTNSGLF